MTAATLPLSVSPIHHGDTFRASDGLEHYYTVDRAFAVRDANGVVLGMRGSKPKADALKATLAKEIAAGELDVERERRELRGAA